MNDPIPLLRGTRPNQQVVVQWSMHTQEREGGPLTLNQDILRPGETDNRRVLRSLADLARQSGGTFIVWHQAFENTRNQEIARDHPDLAEVFQRINAQTFDLETIFADWLWFDRAFQGSSSIKRVLPVLTEVGYEDLAIRKGDQAAELLRRLALKELPPETIAPTLRDLLAYCERDTLAMVKVMEVVI